MKKDIEYQTTVDFTTKAHLNFGSFSLGFGFGMRYANQVTVGNETHRVTSSTNLLVYLVTTSYRSMVQGIERTLMVPW